MITQEQLKAILHYDPETGWFTNLVDRNYNSLAGARVGSLTCGGRYRKVVINKVDYYEHKLAWFYVHGVWISVDHKNGDGVENKLLNLRPASQSQNLCNAQRLTGKSGFVGAYLDDRRSMYQSKIQFGGQQFFLGYYDTAKEANEVYLAAAERLHGEFAYHNRNLAQET